MQRRTALSLRPISQKCYADPRSPMHFNSDSDGKKLIFSTLTLTLNIQGGPDVKNHY